MDSNHHTPSDLPRRRMATIAERIQITKIAAITYLEEKVCSIYSQRLFFGLFERKSQINYFDIGCLGWLSINHVYFQLANSFFLLSYLAPPGLFGLIYFRLMLAIGSAFLAFWALVFVCAFDTFLWNAIFFFINSVHLTILLFSLRPIKLDPQIQQV